MLEKLRSRNLHLSLVLFFGGLFLGLSISFARSADDTTFRFLDQFHFVYQTIRAEYVEDTNARQLFEGAMQGMLAALNDPYTRFLDKEQYAEFREGVTGEFVGIGVEISVKDDEIVVIAPIEDSPAKRAGIIQGDVILKVDETVVRGKNISEVIKQIKGQPESEVKILVRRTGFSEPLEFAIQRAPIHMSSVKYGIIQEQRGKTGYIRITQFFDNTPRDVKKALETYNAQRINRLVLDLRDNPGGNFDSAIEIADFFLPKDTVVVSTRAREGSNISEEYKAKNDVFYNGKILLLVNGGSASASEILAGALQDNKRASLMGQKTFGKALVQRLIDIMPRETGFTLTIRKYFTPSGKMIHKQGIEPDLALEAATIPEADRKNLGRILNDRLVTEFVKNNKTYNDTTVAAFKRFLEEKGLPLSDKVARFHLKHEIGRLQPSPLYDLEFDSELQKALDELHAR